MLLPPLKQKLIIAFLFFTLALLGSLIVFAPKAIAANKPGPNSPSWANGYECASCGDGTWDNPGAFHISSTDAGLQATKTQNNIKFVFDVIATESKGLIVFKGSDGSYAIFENGEYSKPIFVRDLNSTAEGYKPSWTLRQDGLAQDNSQRPQAPGGKEYCSLKYDYSQKDCIDAPTGNKPSFSDEQWERVRAIVENGNDANDSSKDCGDDSTLSFITCPIYNMVNKTIGKLIGADGSGKGLLIDMFYIQPLSFKNATNAKTGQDANPLYTAWDRMKNLALAVYVIIFLVVIFGNSMSLGIDAYTIKKTLPRLMAAAILTQFSFLIMSILIDFSNVIGITLPSFILAQGPQTFTLNLSGMSGFLGGIVAFLLMLILVIMALFSLIVALITIVARQLIVFLLVLTAPLAFAAWVLPNTQTLFKKWWSNLWRILAMFPIATGIIAAAIMFSRIAGHQAGSSNLAQLTGALAPLIALAILPKTFKWGGDFVNAATGAAVGFAAGRKDWVKGKGKDLGKKGYGSARDRVALNAPENARFRHLISGGGFRNSSPKNMIRRGQNKGRILGEYDKAAQYAEKEQLRQLAGSKNKGMQMAAIGRMAKTGDLAGLNEALASGQVTKGVYGKAVNQYYGDFDKMPQMRSVKFAGEADGSRAEMMGDGSGRVAIKSSYHEGMTGESLAGASTESKKHIMGSGEVPASAAQQVINTPALEAKFSSEDIATLRGLAGAAPSGAAGGVPAPGSPTSPIVVAPAPGSSASAGNSSGVESLLKQNIGATKDVVDALNNLGGSSSSSQPPPSMGPDAPPTQRPGSPGQVWNIPPRPGEDDPRDY